MFVCYHIIFLKKQIINFHLHFFNSWFILINILIFILILIPINILIFILVLILNPVDVQQSLQFAPSFLLYFSSCFSPSLCLFSTITSPYFHITFLSIVSAILRPYAALPLPLFLFFLSSPLLILFFLLVFFLSSFFYPFFLLFFFFFLHRVDSVDSRWRTKWT